MRFGFLATSAAVLQNKHILEINVFYLQLALSSVTRHTRERTMRFCPLLVGSRNKTTNGDVLLVFHTNSLKRAGSAYGGHEVRKERTAHIKRPAVGSKAPSVTLSNFIT